MALESVNWKGGEIRVTRDNLSGWEVYHFTQCGGQYGLHWDAHKAGAIRAAKRMAVERGARLLIEESAA